MTEIVIGRVINDRELADLKASGAALFDAGNPTNNKYNAKYGPLHKCVVLKKAKESIYVVLDQTIGDLVTIGKSLKKIKYTDANGNEEEERINLWGIHKDTVRMSKGNPQFVMQAVTKGWLQAELDENMPIKAEPSTSRQTGTSLESEAVPRAQEPPARPTPIATAAAGAKPIAAAAAGAKPIAAAAAGAKPIAAAAAGAKPKAEAAAVAGKAGVIGARAAPPPAKPTATTPQATRTLSQATRTTTTPQAKSASPVGQQPSARCAAGVEDRKRRRDADAAVEAGKLKKVMQEGFHDLAERVDAVQSADIATKLLMTTMSHPLDQESMSRARQLADELCSRPGLQAVIEEQLQLYVNGKA